ncbi:MAG TPA: YaeQ family protein [bacterium]|nr:YaeQ family protein [bacterium]
MGLTATLYRFTLDLSDVDRALYRTLEFRAALHPSESLPFFVTRILAYALNHREGLEFSAGISAPDEPAIRVPGPTGGIDLWIDIGNPAAKRIHKASKSAKEVRIYTHKDAQLLAREFKAEGVHKLESIGLYSLEPKFLNALGAALDRDNHWEITRNEGELYVGVGKETFQGRLTHHPLSGPA